MPTPMITLDDDAVYEQVKARLATKGMPPVILTDAGVMLATKKLLRAMYDEKIANAEAGRMVPPQHQVQALTQQHVPPVMHAIVAVLKAQNSVMPELQTEQAGAYSVQVMIAAFTVLEPLATLGAATLGRTN